MSGKLVDGGENRFLNILLGSTAVDGTLELRLYTDPTTEPSDAVVFADMTEPTAAGYSVKTLTRGSGNWTIVTDTATYGKQTFTATGSWGNVYGYFICVPTTHEMIAVEQFSDGPYNITVSGQSIAVTPVMKAA